MYGISVDVLNQDGYMKTYLLAEGEFLALDGDSCGILVHQYVPDYATDGPSRVSYAPNDQQIIFEAVVRDEPGGLRRIGLDEWTQISETLWLRFSNIAFYVQLIVKHDPGAPVVVVGSLMVLFGMICSFFSRKEVPNLNK